MKEDKINVKRNNVVSFRDSFIANLIDVSIIFILSFILLLILDKVILKVLGYKVVSEYIVIMLFIILAIVAVFYPTCMEYRKGATIGKRFSKIKIKIVDAGEIEEDKIEEVEEINEEDKIEEVNEEDKIDKE